MKKKINTKLLSNISISTIYALHLCLYIVGFLFIFVLLLY